MKQINIEKYLVFNKDNGESTNVEEPKKISN